MRLLDFCLHLTGGRIYHSISVTTAVALAARQVPRDRDDDANAPHSSRSMSVVSRRPDYNSVGHCQVQRGYRMISTKRMIPKCSKLV